MLPEATENAPVPIALGRCFNAEPVLMDSYNHIYKVHEGLIQELCVVRSNGVPINPANAYSMTTASLTNGNLSVGDTIFDADITGTNPLIGGKIYSESGELPTQDIKYKGINTGYNFSAATGQFLVSRLDNPEINPDAYFDSSVVYDYLTQPGWIWSQNKFSINSGPTDPDGALYIKPDYLRAITGNQYIHQIKVENYAVGGSGFLGVRPADRAAPAGQDSPTGDRDSLQDAHHQPQLGR